MIPQEEGPFREWLIKLLETDPELSRAAHGRSDVNVDDEFSQHHTLEELKTLFAAGKDVDPLSLLGVARVYWTNTDYDSGFYPSTGTSTYPTHACTVDHIYGDPDVSAGGDGPGYFTLGEELVPAFYVIIGGSTIDWLSATNHEVVHFLHNIACDTEPTDGLGWFLAGDFNDSPISGRDGTWQSSIGGVVTFLTTGTHTLSFVPTIMALSSISGFTGGVHFEMEGTGFWLLRFKLPE